MFGHPKPNLPYLGQPSCPLKGSNLSTLLQLAHPLAPMDGLPLLEKFSRWNPFEPFCTQIGFMNPNPILGFGLPKPNLPYLGQPSCPLKDSNLSTLLQLAHPLAPMDGLPPFEKFSRWNPFEPFCTQIGFIYPNPILGFGLPKPNLPYLGQPSCPP